jgi:acyl-CoA thioester hydrolase
MQAFVWQVRVYWEDTDAGGVVYHSQYLNFFERARTEWLRKLGVEQEKLLREDGVQFVITQMDIRFRQAARLDVSVESVQTGGARMTMLQQIKRASDAVLIAQADVTAASLDTTRLQPTKMPAWIRAEINNAE